MRIAAPKFKNPSHYDWEAQVFRSSPEEPNSGTSYKHKPTLVESYSAQHEQLLPNASLPFGQRPVFNVAVKLQRLAD